MALLVITVFIIILRRIISLVSIIIFNIIPGLFVMTFSGYYVGLTFGRGLSGGYKMRLAGRGIVDPVYAAISQRRFHNGYGRRGIRLKIVPRLEECIHPRCFGFSCWSKEHWEPCCQRSREQVYDRRPLVKILHHLRV